MAFIITTAQRKGGAGKTTIACHLVALLAKRGFRLAAIDLDDQKSFTTWARRREARLGELDFRLDENARFSPGFRLRKLDGAADIVIIDTPPTLDSVISKTMRESNLVVAPLQLSPLDLDASLPTARMIGDALAPGLFVINRAPPRARIADLIRSKMKELRLPIARTEIGSRAAFAESLATGRIASEIEPSGLAAKEIEKLTDQIIELAQPRLKAAG